MARRKSHQVRAANARVNGQPEIVYIEWVDSTHQAGWLTEEDVQASGVARCVSVGFRVLETSDAITLALSQDVRPEAGRPHGSTITIPKQCITLRAPATAFYSDSSQDCSEAK